MDLADPIFPCKGARDPLSEAALAEAFEKGGWKEVTGLCRGNDLPEDRCWLRAPGWCLTREFRPSSMTLGARCLVCRGNNIG